MHTDWVMARVISCTLTGWGAEAQVDNLLSCVPPPSLFSELKADGVDTSLILRATGHPSPFTYIIVDRSGEAGG